VKHESRWYLRGVVSSAIFNRNLNTCDTKNYAVFTDVGSFRDWIEDKITKYG
jgi:secreted trypsin-like serine protease